MTQEDTVTKPDICASNYRVWTLKCEFSIIGLSQMLQQSPPAAVGKHRDVAKVLLQDPHWQPHRDKGDSSIAVSVDPCNLPSEPSGTPVLLLEVNATIVFTQRPFARPFSTG
jgi:hypothetical protein